MTSDTQKAEAVGQLLETPDLASALESEQFKKFLDQVPIAIAVSDLGSKERVVYANPEFEKLSGLKAATLARQHWAALSGTGLHKQKDRPLFEVVVEDTDFIGTFRLERTEDQPAIVDVYSNVIEDDNGKVCFRLVALVDVSAHGETEDARSLDERIREKDTLLRELQHRVKNNLQMITALIRMETRNAAEPDQKRFERLAGRVDALAILYQTLSGDYDKDEVDLGVYLSQIASAVMNSHAVEGIRLDMKVDTYPVSINVAMPTGLVVNELLTNALKHAFQGRNGGTITLHSVVDGDGCRIVIADDGIGLPEGESWPKRGKLGALIARSLTENAKAEFDVKSSAGEGTKVTILFKRSAATA
ncbi:PAS domain-containing protein [Mesorhizobium sp. M7A.F.Ca.CA.001.07.2.1]|uniref:sensor histidine kinase n=3 Tax=Phyllobacteriaceae TaxID=69277 RepID=UPI000FCB8CF9|nr:MULTISPECIES: histidine kinase dimerization/phosphoacceptor domain -containing protein [Mesorhizobium]RVB46658.1 PAS domain-containing protein [Mesorhizobium sp. M7A.F.Ca.CA.004.05.1.1]MCF6122111.1 ATP-binding protein [Mesorhizobium ciceri]MCQ8812692.1 ATP-binding protein [Mesorhizobium sp. SEMIA396]RUX79735.1 PAS domain-containing protein [Mesorhizobium sp. M7A.F.Ca.CA.004.08.2.1]RUX87104.1 PAS domain-containing protein [Mesorhizobium sp. M7A.F.Ca.CA.004.08.1.1]